MFRRTAVMSICIVHFPAQWRVRSATRSPWHAAAAAAPREAQTAPRQRPQRLWHLNLAAFWVVSWRRHKGIAWMIEALVTFARPSELSRTGTASFLGLVLTQIRAAPVACMQDAAARFTAPGSVQTLRAYACRSAPGAAQSAGRALQSRELPACALHQPKTHNTAHLSTNRNQNPTASQPCCRDALHRKPRRASVCSASLIMGQLELVMATTETAIEREMTANCSFPPGSLVRGGW